MSIVLARVDNRLVHGQVLEAWVPHTHATCILVANDELASSAIRRMMVEASVPRSLKVVVGTVDEISRDLSSSARFSSYRILLLFASSSDALRAHRQGVPFTQLNLGNMHKGKETVAFSCTIHLDREDIENLRQLEREGVEIVSRCVPMDRGQNWRKLIRNIPD